MRRIATTSICVLALLFMATLNLHAASGTYIDCIHGCPDLIVCTNCCNETFSSILTTCNANRDRCESICVPGDTGCCLDACMFARNDCLMQDIRDFVCSQWKEGDPQPGLTKSESCGLDCHEYVWPIRASQ